MRNKKVIKIKNPDCKNPNIMLQNYSGLWQTLRVRAALKQDYGFMLKMGNTLYKLEA
jgi:hypothetical protein|tara:strand:- start:205 stop:375 length:171 start_codon:yes stop_codon:yes gene_type:complete